MMAFEIVCFFLLDGRECGMMVETTRCVDVSIIRPVVSWVGVFLMDGRVILIYGWCCVCGLGSLFYHFDERHITLVGCLQINTGVAHTKPHIINLSTEAHPVTTSKMA